MSRPEIAYPLVSYQPIMKYLVWCARRRIWIRQIIHPAATNRGCVARDRRVGDDAPVAIAVGPAGLNRSTIIRRVIGKRAVGDKRGAYIRVQRPANAVSTPGGVITECRSADIQAGSIGHNRPTLRTGRVAIEGGGLNIQCAGVVNRTATDGSFVACESGSRDVQRGAIDHANCTTSIQRFIGSECHFIDICNRVSVDIERTGIALGPFSEVAGEADTRHGKFNTLHPDGTGGGFCIVLIKDRIRNIQYAVVSSNGAACSS